MLAATSSERQQLITSHVNRDGETPVHMACRLGYLNIVHTLLDENFPADQCISDGTPLHALIQAKQAGQIHKLMFVI